MRMMIIPIIRCRDMERSLAFYTGILGFEIEDPDSKPTDPVINLTNGHIGIQLSTGEGYFGNPINVWVEDVDTLFKYYIERGLDTSGKEGSPVHQGPLDQTWGMREFYVTDPDGNTMRFGKPIG
jgi:catechol 2,3-dioxygenase-like lactoylglutathione lyase family enzyme